MIPAERAVTALTDLEASGVARNGDDTRMLHFPWEKNPLPMNGSRGSAWRKAAREERQVRDVATLRIRSARIPAAERVRAQVTWWVMTRTVRDPDNLARLEKRLFDAIVRAGVVADDRPELMDKPRAEIRHIPSTPDAPVSRAGFTLTITRLGGDTDA